MPAGLSTTTKPSTFAGWLRRERATDAFDDGVDRRVARETGCEPMAAAAEPLRDGAHIDGAAAAQAHAHRTVGILLEYRAHIGFLGAPHHVDQPLDLFHRHVVCREVGLRDCGPHEALL